MQLWDTRTSDDFSEFRTLLDEAERGGVHVIDVLIDVQQNVILMKEMKSVDCSQFMGT